MRLLRVVMLSLAVSGSTIAAPRVATAAVAWTINDANKQDRPTTVDFTGAFWFFGATQFFGGAGWFGYPIVPEGFLPTLNDTFNLELGAWAFYYSYTLRGGGYSYQGLIPGGGVRWDFNLTKEWTVFATAKLGIGVGVGQDRPRTFWFAPAGSIGAYWNFSRQVFVRLETGNLGIIQAGLSFVL